VQSNQIVGRRSSSPFHESSNANSPAPLDRKALITPGSFVGLTIDDAFTWYTQFTSWLSNNQPALSGDFSTLETDILDLFCQAFLSDVETDLNRELLFKQDWQQCVARGETWVQNIQQSVYGPNNTNPLGSGLGGHYVTVAFNLAASIGVKAGCDFLFAQLIK
jgi:hypothetical protein